ncbi:LytTR family DNA-binding domain-containing protein [Epilithonimonas sp. JDS]|nr:LytTR family DNA-binding domain-containing protein [Epilithonimonas sp. JDS]
MERLNCIIIDDNEIDRLTVLSFAKKFPNLNILGTFSDSRDALKAIESSAVDVLFLDIDMAELTGVELRKKVKHVPACIFITSHPEYAVESFELETLDFIVKPLKFDRFEKTMTRIIHFFEMKNKANLFESSIGGDVIYIKEGHDQIKLKLHEILYLEALKDYTLVVTSQKRHCVLSSIGHLLKEGSFRSFIRIHRSFAVQKQFINKINTHEIVLHNDLAIPIGRSFKENLKLLL